MAILLVINATAHLFIKDVCDTTYVHINVNSKNENVDPPMEPDNTELNFNSGTNAKAARHSKLGQSIEIVNHKSKTPTKVPNTCIADAESPAGPGINLKKTIHNSEIHTNIFLLEVDELLLLETDSFDISSSPPYNKAP